MSRQPRAPAILAVTARSDSRRPAQQGNRMMWLRLVIAAALAAATLAVPAAAPASTPGSRLYLALGDSFAAGFGASVPAESGYVPLLFRTLQAPGRWRVARLRNLAVPGETTSSILGSQLDAALAAIADPGTDVRVVTLDIGGNDVLDQAACAVDPVACGLADRYATLLTRLRAALAVDPGPEALVVMAYANPWSGTGAAMEAFADDTLMGADRRIECSGTPEDIGLNDVLSCVGAQFGARTADIYHPTLGRALELTHIASGDVHFNDPGYALVADVFANVLRPHRTCERAAIDASARARPQ
jgi:lysophospholipase L1-like esterase